MEMPTLGILLHAFHYLIWNKNWSNSVSLIPAVGFGMDPDLQIDIITELDLMNTTIGVTQVPGLHNASKAFLFQGKTRVLDSLSPILCELTRALMPESL